MCFLSLIQILCATWKIQRKLESNSVTDVDSQQGTRDIKAYRNGVKDHIPLKFQSFTANQAGRLERATRCGSLLKRLLSSKEETENSDEITSTLDDDDSIVLRFTTNFFGAVI